ncbi:DUF5977 domain-containing protein [Chitinophaga sp. RCC_12]|uniref:DUF5977 domain-containing protein n=1 Tax=Chitinophaga sp. RCC_12 TaxID=3239226 RepID=UPI003523BABD
MPGCLKLIRSCYALIVCGILYPHIVSSQNTAFDEMRKIPITSPDVASLTKAAEFPVTYFNGRPEVSIPIYTIRTGDLEFPISLSYNGGGIRVSEEASWVGLGWTLNVGGVISRQIKGADDDLVSNKTFKQYYPDALGNTYQAGAQARNFMLEFNLLYKANGQAYTKPELCPFFCPGDIDGEPDLYVYNFGKYTGKFTGFSTAEVVDVSGNNIRFEKSGGGIIATDPEGFRYEFMAIEMSMTAAGPTKTAYYLTKITSPANRILTLKYKTFREYVYPATGAGHSTDYTGISSAFTNVDYVTQMPDLSEEYIQYQAVSMRGPMGMPTNGGLNSTFSTSTIRTLFLDSVLFENGAVQFIPDSRKDLFGVKLNGITVFNKAGSAVMTAGFDYDYFTARQGNESYTTPSTRPGIKLPYDESYRRKRLKLKGVTVKGEVYKCYYYEGADGFTLPYKSSFEQDYWGYYNGAASNTTLVPDFKRYNFLAAIPQVLRSWIGANRDAKFPQAQEGMLKKIMYPTKGLAEFEYGLHEFNNAPADIIVNYNNVGALNTTTGVTATTVDIAANCYVDITVNLFCNQPADANPTGTGWDCSCIFPPCSPLNMQNAMWVTIERVDPATGAVSPTEWEYDFSKDIVRNQSGNFVLTNQYFTAGRYKLTANYPDNKVGAPGQKMAYISLKIPVTTNVAPYGIGGGLRLTSSSRFDPVSKITSKKLYTYEQGMMMHFPTYYSGLKNQQTDLLPGTEVPVIDEYITHTLYASPRQPYSFSANGSPVGYGKVKENFTGEALGRTEYLYNVIPDKYPHLSNLDLIPGTPPIPSLENGFLKTVNFYDNANRLVKSVSNTAVVKKTQTFWAFKQRKQMNSQTVNTANFDMYLHLSFYPIQTGKLLTATSTETMYDNVNTPGITTSKTFEYNDRAFLQSEQLTRSDGTPVVKHYRYPGDFTATTGWIGELKTRNMISMPVEAVTQVNGKLVEGTYKTFALHDNIVTPNEVFAAETLTPATVAFIAPSGTLPAEYKSAGQLDYDAKGNLNYSKSNNNISIGYKWGYNKMYPVAECKNAVPSQFYYEDFEGNGPLVSNTSTAHTGKGGYNGSIMLASQFSATTAGRTYRLSYFKQNGTVWEHIDQPYTGQSLSGVVDDIRIYPQDGEMTTYTYLPLVGISSIITPSGNTSFYSYDAYNRLSVIRDQDGYVMKTFNYAYSATLGQDNSTTYPNVAITQNFYKQCTTGEGSLVPYTVPAGKYTAGSPEEANALAQAEIDLQGQSNANTNGTCDVGLAITSIVNGPGTTFTVNFTCPPGMNFFINLFAKDPVTGRPYNDRPFVVPLGSTSFTGDIAKGKTWIFSITAGGTNFPSGISSANVSFTFP